MVIQRLFAAGLSLQSAARLAVRPEVQRTVDGAVDVIDGVIRDIREAIFELHHSTDQRSLRTELRDLIETATVQLGFAPQLRMDGPLEAAVQGQLRANVLAVVRELLSNAARHARATQVGVEVDASANRIRVTVSDDGSGLGDSTHRSGLANLERRAEEVDGLVRGVVRASTRHGCGVAGAALVSHRRLTGHPGPSALRRRPHPA